MTRQVFQKFINSLKNKGLNVCCTQTQKAQILMKIQETDNLQRWPTLNEETSPCRNATPNTTRSSIVVVVTQNQKPKRVSNTPAEVVYNLGNIAKARPDSQTVSMHASCLIPHLSTSSRGILGEAIKCVNYICHSLVSY